MNYETFNRFLLSMINDPCYRGESWVVYFKCINTVGEQEDYYEVFNGDLDNNTINWFNDWYEGQTNIDVWGAYNIECLVKEERGDLIENN